MTFICPKCDREIKHEKQWHYCKKISIDNLFAGKNHHLLLTFDQVLSVVTEWENVIVSVTKNCVVFVHRQTFLVIRPMQKQLDIKCYSTEAMHEFPIIKSVFYSGRYENHIRVTHVDDLDKMVYFCIRNSYNLL